MNLACFRFHKEYGKSFTMFGYGSNREEIDWTIHERVDFEANYTQVWSSGDDRYSVSAKLPLWITSEL